MLLLAVATGSFGQQKKSTGLSLKDRKLTVNQHALFIEVGGSAYIYSFNYETLILNRGITRWYGRLGLEWLPMKQADRIIHFPIMTSVAFLKKRWQPEIGFGALFRLNFDPGLGFGEGFYFTDPPTNIFFTPTFGVRWHSKPNDYNETWLLKIAFTPLLGMDVFTGSSYFQPWAGVSFGRTWSGRGRKK